MDKLMGFGIKHAQGRWRVVEIRSNPAGVHWQHQQRRTFLGAGAAEGEAKGQAVVTRTKYLGELR